MLCQEFISFVQLFEFVRHIAVHNIHLLGNFSCVCTYCLFLGLYFIYLHFFLCFSEIWGFLEVGLLFLILLHFVWRLACMTLIFFF